MSTIVAPGAAVASAAAAGGGSTAAAAAAAGAGAVTTTASGCPEAGAAGVGALVTILSVRRSYSLVSCELGAPSQSRLTSTYAAFVSTKQTKFLYNNDKCREPGVQDKVGGSNKALSPQVESVSIGPPVLGAVGCRHPGLDANSEVLGHHRWDLFTVSRTLSTLSLHLTHDTAITWLLGRAWRWWLGRQHAGTRRGVFPQPFGLYWPSHDDATTVSGDAVPGAERPRLCILPLVVRRKPQVHCCCCFRLVVLVVVAVVPVAAAVWYCVLLMVSCRKVRTQVQGQAKQTYPAHLVVCFLMTWTTRGL